MPIYGKDKFQKDAVFLCECSSFEHQFVVMYEIPDEDQDKYPVDPHIYFGVRMNSFGTWYQRVWRAIKYVFKCGEADYSDVLLMPHKVDELIDFLEDGLATKKVCLPDASVVQGQNSSLPS